jgi:predicted dehydrogenase
MSINRRSFLNRSAAALAGTALSYRRIQGANERISLGHIGVGSRGTELAWIVSQLKDQKNVEMTAVCDLWKVNRERAAAKAEAAYGRAPRSFQYFEDLLALKDVDAVLISTPDFAHSPLLKLAVESGKDAYCEKPMGNVLEEAKAARDAVLARNSIVQIGTQHRSEPYQIAARNLIAAGALGQVTKYEIVWNYHGPAGAAAPK